MTKRNARTTSRLRPRIRLRELVTIRADEIDPHPENFRAHPEHQRTALRRLLDDVGFVGALLVRRVGKRYQLLDGHLRLEELDPAAKVPAAVLDLDDDEARAVLAGYDQVASLATIDPEKFEALRRGLADFRDRFGDLFRDSAVWHRAGLPSAAAEAHAGDRPGAAAPRTFPPEARRLAVRRGAIVRVRGNVEHVVRCGDGLDAPVVTPDLVATDPPYESALDRLAGLAPRFVLLASDRQHAAFCAVATLRFFRVWAHGARRTFFSKRTPVQRHTLAGYYVAAGGHLAWTRERSDAESLIDDEPYQPEFGGYAKTVSLMRRLLAGFDRRVVRRVLDPFAGSGATLLACDELGISSTSVELDGKVVGMLRHRCQLAGLGTSSR